MKIITHVAMLYDNIVWSLPEPYRHHHVLHAVHKKKEAEGALVEYQNAPVVQGFLTSEGMFVDRYDAYQMFTEYGQQEYDIDREGQLYSENCWRTAGNWMAPDGSEAHALYHHTNDKATISSLLKEEPFIGSKRPYRIDTVMSDIYHRERVVILVDDVDFSAQIAPVLYSQIHRERMSDPHERIKRYFETLLPSSNKYVRISEK